HIHLSRFSCSYFTEPRHPDTNSVCLHDALPIWHWRRPGPTTPRCTMRMVTRRSSMRGVGSDSPRSARSTGSRSTTMPISPGQGRSEEHTSELQSRFDLVCRLLLEKKNIIKQYIV